MGYFSYLRKRRLTGLLYRRLWLYPRLCKRLEGRVLDVGCGIGDFLNFRSGTVGVDIDASAVAWCRNLGLDAHVMTPDALPFDNATFDAVVLDNVLEHLAAPNALLSEFCQCTAHLLSVCRGVWAMQATLTIRFTTMRLRWLLACCAMGFIASRLFICPSAARCWHRACASIVCTVLLGSRPNQTD
jgi:SAM-dependent methyltransferase